MSDTSGPDSSQEPPPPPPPPPPGAPQPPSPPPQTPPQGPPTAPGTPPGQYPGDQATGQYPTAAPTGQYPAAPAAPGGPGGPGDTTYEQYGSEPSGGRRGKGGKIAVAIVAIALLGGGVAFAANNIGGDNGPGSPEAAVDVMLESVANEDILGTLESIDPGERDAVLDDVEAMFDELQRLGVVDGSFEASGIDGVDIEFENLEYETEEIREGLERVYITGGTVATSFEPSELPAGDLVHDLLERFGGEPLAELDGESETTDITKEDNGFIVVRDTGSDGWRVSVGYTIAEQARYEAGEPALTGGIEPIGEDSPEAAVEGYIRLIENLDPEEALARLSPSEFRALHEYADVLIGDLTPPDTGPVTITVDEVDLDADTSGSKADVRINGFTITATWDDDAGIPSGSATVNLSSDGFSVAVEWEDGPGFPAGSALVTITNECLTIESDSDVVEEILQQSPFPDGELCFDDVAELAEVFGGGMELGLDELPEPPDFSDMGTPEFSIRTVEVDGDWYVAPIGTYASLSVKALELVDRELIESYVTYVEELMGSFEGLFEDAVGEDLIPTDPLSPPTTASGDTEGVTDEDFESIRPDPSLDLTEGDLDDLRQIAQLFMVDDETALCAYEIFVTGEVDTEALLDSFANDPSPSDEAREAIDYAEDNCS